MDAGVYDIEISPEEFSQRLEQGERLLISFGATWCGPCKQMQPTLQKLGTMLAGELRVGRIECDLHPDPGKAHRIRAYPTLVLFDKGVELGRVVGLQSLGQLKSLIGKTQPAGQPLQALAMTRPDWGAFYGNPLLRECLVGEVLRLAADGKLILPNYPAWDGHRGSASAALVASGRPEIFERISGMPYSFALVLELANLSSEAQCAAVFGALAAGKDVSTVFLQVLVEWLTDGEEEWPRYLADATLDALRLRWVSLVRERLAGGAMAEADWAALRDAVQPLADVRREHEVGWFLALFIRDMSPPPALDASAAVLMPSLRGIRMLRHLLCMYQAGATQEVLETPDAIHAWLKSRWTEEAWQALPDEVRAAEFAQMEQALAPRLAAKKVVDDAAALIREARHAAFLSRLVALLEVCPLITDEGEGR